MPVRLVGSMLNIILWVIKISCFVYIFLWFKVPIKCLGVFFRFMVAIVKRLLKMGCDFCLPKREDDDFPKKKHSNLTDSSSGMHSQYNTNPSDSGRYSSKSSPQFGKVIGIARDIPIQANVSQNRTSSFNSESPYNEGSRQFETIQRAAAENLRLANSNFMSRVLVPEPGRPSSSNVTNTKQSTQLDSHRNTVVYQIDENNKKSYKKHEVSMVHSLPATHLDKSPVTYQGIKHNLSSSYDSSLSWNAHTADRSANSGPEDLQMPTTSYPDPYDRNSFRFLNKNKQKTFLPDEESFRTTPTSSIDQLPFGASVANIRCELSSEASGSYNDTNGNMETDGSLKRTITSQSAQGLGITESYLADEYNSEIVDSSTKRFKEAPPEKDPLINETILAELERCLRERYNKSFTSGNVHRYYLEMCKLEESGSIRRKFCSLSELFPPIPKWRMLVYGKPFFGKTQLCRDVTVVWHSSLTDQTGEQFENVRDFKILIHHHLKPGSDLDLEKCLVDECHNMLPKNFVTKDEFKDAWYEYMFGTLFVLDGYGKLSDSEKRSVIMSLRQDFFDEASILLTCSPDVDDELRQSFNIHVDICGFNRTMLYESANYNSQHLNSYDECKIENLYGISPVYTSAVVNSFNQTDKPKSLYDLLNSVVNFLTSSTTLNDKTLEHIGSLFFEGLKYRHFVLEEETLRLLLNKSWQDLKRCGLFVACPSKPNKARKVVVSHKLFMVYFSVRYLREKWKKLTIPAQRDVFLKAQLCFEDSSGVYIATSDETPKLFFAGVIPEIVFDFHNDVFQMVQDVSEPDLTTAFEPQSLLLRVDSKRLHVFGITAVENPDLQHLFAKILNILDFEDLTIDMKFYFAINSLLYYLKIVVIDEDENRPVMMIVTSINPENSDQIQEIHLDFLQSDIKILHLFLQKFVETFFVSCQIDPEMSAVDLVFHLVTLCLSLPCDIHTHLTLGSRSDKPSSLVTWEVMSSSCGEPISSLVYLNEDVTVLRRFDSKVCRILPCEPHSSKVIDKMNKSVSKCSDPGISINVKFVF